MAIFALACEGITDQIVIENILCGFYKDYPDLDEEIIPLQPPYDATTRKQKEGEFGGWEMLLEYLSEKRFRDDVLNNEYIIVQIDTDISDHPNFNVSKQTKSIEEFINSVRERLIKQIDKKIEFYQFHQDKIIFAISVHSLECWILPLYRSYKNEKITGCFQALQREAKNIKVVKNYRTYEKLSLALSQYRNLIKTVQQNSSLKIFIERLPTELG